MKKQHQSIEEALKLIEDKRKSGGIVPAEEFRSPNPVTKDQKSSTMDAALKMLLKQDVENAKKRR